jgi:hypothetical protein
LVSDFELNARDCIYKVGGQEQSGNSLYAYQNYVAYELRAKRPDLGILSNIHERAIAEAAKRRASSEAGAEEALRLWWASYVDSLVCYRLAQALICTYSSRLNRDATTRPWSSSYPCFDVQ